jgi:hypothetical protein
VREEHPVPCYISFRNGRGRWQNNPQGRTLFEAAYNVCAVSGLVWTAAGPDTALGANAGWGGHQKTYYVGLAAALARYGQTHAEFFKTGKAV